MARDDAALAPAQVQEQTGVAVHAGFLPTANSTGDAAAAISPRDMQTDWGYGPDEEVGYPGEGNSDEESCDDERYGDEAAALRRVQRRASEHAKLLWQNQAQEQQQLQLHLFHLPPCLQCHPTT
jgi:hypothetical protein